MSPPSMPLSPLVFVFILVTLPSPIITPVSHTMPVFVPV